MRAKQALSTLKQIAAIRDVQYRAAEAQAAHAAQRLRTKEHAFEERQHEEASAKEHWGRLVSTSSLDLNLLQLWSMEVLRRNDAVAKAAAETEQAAKHLNRRMTERHIAAKRRDIGADLMRKAATAERNRREEGILQKALDRHAYAGRED